MIFQLIEISRDYRHLSKFFKHGKRFAIEESKRKEPKKRKGD